MNPLEEIYSLILSGKRHEITAVVQQALDEGISAGVIVEQAMRPAMNEVGERFASGEFFLPDLILAAEATKSAIKFLQPYLGQDDSLSHGQTIVIGTVQGDLHDIGKNLVIATLEGVGFEVVDLGIDVPPQQFVEAVRAHQPAVVGFSALLSTTMPNIRNSIEALEEAGLRHGRLMAVGGAPVDRRHVEEWGADVYAPDAGTAARIITEKLSAF